MCCGLLAGLLWGASAPAADKPVVTWMMGASPPASMPVDGKLTDGFYDVAVKLVAQEWPEVEHRVVVVNGGRALSSLSSNMQACFASAVRTPERDRVGYFTASYLLPPLKVVAKPDKLTGMRKNAAGEVLPANLFDRDDLRGIIIPNRSYSPVVDALLALRPASSGLRTVITTDGGANLLKMLALDRADYSLAYDHTLVYNLKQNPDAFRHTQLVAAPLAGTETVLTGVYCPRSDWGREAVMRIDAILAKVSQTPQYRNALHRWLSPDAVARHKLAEAAFYAQRAKVTDPARFAPASNNP